jgi:hypothetical protein
MKTTIAITIDTDKLASVTDTYLAQLWHIAQANPAPVQDREAGELVEKIGREIIRRFLAGIAPELWAHQGEHYYWWTLAQNGTWVNNTWTPSEASAQ